ncbi:hypothetical protein XHC_3641 [Xanthomonas hortorum pv. carotae str. M081]|nr:hypothetical protein XHC_3641 [Xanthomonas hortorum pv. carotae str. M081]
MDRCLHYSICIRSLQGPEGAPVLSPTRPKVRLMIQICHADP